MPAGLAFVPSLSKGTTHLQHLLAVESGPIEVPRHESHHRRGHHTHADGHRVLVLLCEGLELPLQGRGRLQVAAMAGQGDREPEQRFPPEPPVFGAPGQVQCLSIVRLGGVQVALPVPDPGQADETLDPSLTRSPRVDGEEVLQPPTAFVQVPPELPEPPHPCGHQETQVGLSLLLGPPEGCPQVGPLCLQSSQPLGLFGHGELRFGLLHEVQVEVRVSPMGLPFLAGRVKLLEGVLADRLQHGEAGLAGFRGSLEQAHLHERGDPFQDVLDRRPRGHSLGGIEGEATGQGPQPPEQSPVCGVQQPMPPANGIAQGLLPG